MISRVALAFLLFVLPSRTLFACSCYFISLDPNAPKLSNGNPVPDLREITAKDLTLFLGEAVEVTPTYADKPHMWLSSVTRFRVARYWNGKVGKEMTIESGFPGGGCGWVFEKGKTYLVFATPDKNGVLTTTICTRTALVTDVPDLLDWVVKLAGKGRTPE